MPFCLFGGAVLLILISSCYICYDYDIENFEYFSTRVVELQKNLDTYKDSAVKRETILSNIDEILVRANESQIKRAILVLEISSSHVSEDLTQNIVILKETLYETTIEKCEMALKILES